jgi:hypothetical protein
MSTGQSSGFGSLRNGRPESASRHVGRDRDRAFASGLRDDLGFALVIFRVQDVVRHADLL